MRKNRFIWLLVLVVAVGLIASPAFAAKKAEKKAAAKPAAPSAGSAPAAGVKDPIPQNNGCYLFAKEKLTELKKPAYKEDENNKRRFIGFVDDSPFWVATAPSAMIVLYEPRVTDPAKLRLQTMKFEGTRKSDGSTMKTKRHNLEMWITGEDVPYKFHESSDKPGVWVFTPEKPLAAGRYVAYWGKNIEDAIKNKVPRVFIFEVK
jgi:hypothetical protein